MLWARVRGRSNQLSVKFWRSLRSSMNASCLRLLLVVQMSCEIAASSPYHLKSSMMFCVGSVCCTHFPTIAWAQVSPAAFGSTRWKPIWLSSFSYIRNQPHLRLSACPTGAGSKLGEDVVLRGRVVNASACQIKPSIRRESGRIKTSWKSIWRLNEYMDNTVYITS